MSVVAQDRRPPACPWSSSFLVSGYSALVSRGLIITVSSFHETQTSASVQRRANRAPTSSCERPTERLVQNFPANQGSGFPLFRVTHMVTSLQATSLSAHALNEQEFIDPKGYLGDMFSRKVGISHGSAISSPHPHRPFTPWPGLHSPWNLLVFFCLSRQTACSSPAWSERDAGSWVW